MERKQLVEKIFAFDRLGDARFSVRGSGSGVAFTNPFLGVPVILLISLFIALVVVSVGIGLAAFRLTRVGPTSWGRAAARKFGAIPAALGIAVIGWVATIAIVLPVGWIAKALEDAVDRPTLAWFQKIVHPSAFTKFNSYVTTLGDRSTIDLICVVSVLILAFAYRRQWWMPVVAIAAAFIAQHEGQLLLGKLLGRNLPPVTHAGAFPSGGVSRMLTVDGVIIILILLLLPTISRRWHAGLWTGLFTFAVIEGYTRVYLSLHWFTDVVAGLIFGVLLCLTFVAASAALTTGAKRLEGPASLFGEHQSAGA